MQRSKLTYEFIKIRTMLQEQELLNATLKWYTAPIIYSSKPSVLINLGNHQSSQMAQLWCQLRKPCINAEGCYLSQEQNSNNYPYEIDNDKGIILTPFIGINDSLHLFCYIPKRIQTICQDKEIRKFLDKAGYSHFDPGYCIARLKRLFRQGCPHEVGIFLGYPLADVDAFIQNKGRNYLLNGYWKVYSDVPRAEQIFNSYDKAKIKVLKQWRNMKQ